MRDERVQERVLVDVEKGLRATPEQGRIQQPCEPKTNHPEHRYPTRFFPREMHQCPRLRLRE